MLMKSLKKLETILKEKNSYDEELVVADQG
jgi:hypothetical protein